MNNSTIYVYDNMSNVQLLVDIHSGNKVLCYNEKYYDTSEISIRNIRNHEGGNNKVAFELIANKQICYNGRTLRKWFASKTGQSHTFSKRFPTIICNRQDFELLQSYIEKFNMSKFNDVFVIIHQLGNYIKENQEDFNTMQNIIKKDHPLFASETSITDTIKTHIDNIYKQTELQSIFDLIFTEGLFECLRSIKTQYAYFFRNNKEHIDILNKLDSYGREIASYYEIFKRYVDYFAITQNVEFIKNTRGNTSDAQTITVNG